MIEQLDKEHIDMLLKTEVVGHLACCEGDRPYVVPITYVYDDGYIYGHTSEGKKIEILRKNPNVCVEVERVKNPVNWRSVIAFGTFEELHGESAEKAMDKLVHRLANYMQGDNDEPVTKSTLEAVARQIHVGPNESVLYRIKIMEKHGRYELN